MTMTAEATDDSLLWGALLFFLEWLATSQDRIAKSTESPSPWWATGWVGFAALVMGVFTLVLGALTFWFAHGHALVALVAPAWAAHLALKKATAAEMTKREAAREADRLDAAEAEDEGEVKRLLAEATLPLQQQLKQLQLQLKQQHEQQQLLLKQQQLSLQLQSEQQQLLELQQLQLEELRR